jgi:hypothetical protein
MCIGSFSVMRLSKTLLGVDQSPESPKGHIADEEPPPGPKRFSASQGVSSTEKPVRVEPSLGTTVLVFVALWRAPGLLLGGLIFSPFSTQSRVLAPCFPVETP